LLGASVTSQQQESSQQQGAGDSSMSIDALYKLIGAMKTEQRSTLSTEQQAHVSRVQQQQLTQAAAAEAATIGAWLAPPRQMHCAAADDGSCSSGSMCSSVSQHAAAYAEQSAAAPIQLAPTAAKADVEAGRLDLRAGVGSTPDHIAVAQPKKSQQCPSTQQDATASDEEEAVSAAKRQGLRKDTWQTNEPAVPSHRLPANSKGGSISSSSAATAGGDSINAGNACSSSGGHSDPGDGAAAIAARSLGQGQGSKGALLRARHSAILHVAMMKAAAAADSLAAEQLDLQQQQQQQATQGLYNKR
jgi:hypothetical protein